MPRLARALRRLRAEVVHTHNPLPLIYGAPAARLAGAAAIHTKHGTNPGGRAASRLLRRAAAQLAHAFVAVSETTAEQAREQHDAPRAKLHTIPNGIRLDRYHPDPEARAAARVELGLGDAWVVGTVGRLDSVQEPGACSSARWRRCCRRSVRLVIIGDGPTRAPRSRPRSRALPEPRVGRDDGPPDGRSAAVHAFDVFALSSKTEGLPLVVPEAMAAGLPIVTTAVGGIPSVVDEGETGLLVPVDEAALSPALATLVGDPERRARDGRARPRGRARALQPRSHGRGLPRALRSRGLSV